ncbi:MAG: rhodanese-like domain-containing protein [Candidatus Binatia bacterium]
MTEPEIDVSVLATRLAGGEPTMLLDVRETWEHEIAALPGSLLVSLGELPGRLDEVRPPEGTLLVIYCHHGMRSLQATLLVRATGVSQAVSLAGGIDAWSRAVDPRVPRY